MRRVAGPWRRRIGAVAGPLVLAGIIAYLVAGHGAAIAHAADRASAATLLGTVALSALTLIARTEAVVACLDAMGDRPRRGDIHAANGLTFLAGAVNHYLAAPVRATLLGRIDAERSPGMLQMIMVDAATSIIEGTLIVALVIVSAGTLRLRWWIVALLVLAAIAGVAVVLAARRRFRSHPAVRGLDVLVHSRRRLAVAGLMAAVIGLNVLRTMLVLDATGLRPSLLQGAATFIAAGVLSTLLVGPSAGNAGAPLLIFGHRSIGAAGAAGLILSATALLASVLYALAVAPLYARRLRRPRVAAA